MHTFGQGSGDDKLRNLLGIAVSHNTIAVSEHKNHIVKKFSLLVITCPSGVRAIANGLETHLK